MATPTSTATCISSKFFPTAVGYPLANVPKQTFNLFVTHRLPWRLNAGLGSNYVGSRTASSTVPYVPTGFAPKSQRSGLPRHQRRHEAGARLLDLQRHAQAADHGAGLSCRPTSTTCSTAIYIDLPHPSHLIPGAGANALIGINFRFK